MKLIVGLGNPGTNYIGTRHNAGFEFIRVLKDQIGFGGLVEDKKLKSAITEGLYNNEKIILAMPLTFMNLSGDALSKLKYYYKFEDKNILIVYDDLDLPIGSFRYREKGSAGTHNGMKSIIDFLKTEEIQRLRIGIESRGEISNPNINTSSFVLSKFSDTEREVFDRVVLEAVNHVKNNFLIQ